LTIFVSEYPSISQEIPMNKADLITALKDETDLTKLEAEAVVNLH